MPTIKFNKVDDIFEPPRGAIGNEKFARQLRDYSGLRYGKITPTDIDGALDFNNRLFAYFELKYQSMNLPYGQRLAFERQCDGMENGGIPAYYFLCVHNDHPDESPIMAHRSEVVAIRHNKTWIEPRAGTTLREAIDRARDIHKI